MKDLPQKSNVRNTHYVVKKKALRYGISGFCASAAIYLFTPSAGWGASVGSDGANRTTKT